MKELSTILLCRSQVVQLRLPSTYSTFFQKGNSLFPHLSSTVNQPSKKSEKKLVLTLLFPLSGKKWLIGKGHKTEMILKSQVLISYKILLKNVILVYVFVRCCNMLMSKAHKTEHKKNLATTFKTNGRVKFYLSPLQNKFHWCSVSWNKNKEVYGWKKLSAWEQARR